MAKRDPQRTDKLRIAVRYLLERGEMVQGSQSRLAEHFKVSRQRVHQIVVEERATFLRQRAGHAVSASSARMHDRAAAVVRERAATETH